MTTPIPQPPTSWIPLIGNAHDLDSEIPVQSLFNIATEYGPIFTLNMFGQRAVFLSSHEYVVEVYINPPCNTFVHTMEF